MNIRRIPHFELEMSDEKKAIHARLDLSAQRTSDIRDTGLSGYRNLARKCELQNPEEGFTAILRLLLLVRTRTANGLSWRFCSDHFNRSGTSFPHLGKTCRPRESDF
ncbi:hypothetical protein [Actibacterium pelagium]|uniref:hypothetical protein n=1 Tax=Actibacterium pelagium TaxID=2029103 RepID=UPI0011775C4A|nr:hypothetical protein [Actibacterium pelagium]